MVLGAGLAGLSATDLLSENGIEVLVLEKEAGPGGLAATVRSGDFHFDFGPHRFHTERTELLDMVKDLLPGELLELERLSRIRLLDRYFMYPLSLGDVLKRMPVHRGAGMMLSYATERFRNLFSPRPDADFEGWVVRRFGRKLYDLYFGPYTEKLWGCRADTLSADWASQRITVPGLSGLIRSTLFPSGGRVRSLVSTFHYPRGGIGRICCSLADRCVSRGTRIRYGTVPEAIYRKAGGGFTIETAEGTIEADSIVNTIPVGELVRLLKDPLPEGVRDRAEELRFRAIVFVTLKLSVRVEAEDHWIYAPEADYLFNRLSIPENFDAACTERGSQVVFEFTCDPGDDIWNGGDELIESAVSGGERLGLFRRDQFESSMITRQEHAYPIYDMNYARRVATVLNALDAEESIVTCGRQGLFRYNNMDHSIEMGRYAAMELLGKGSVRERFAWTADTWADG